MIAIGRDINGCSLNGLEYVLDNDGNINKFQSEEEIYYIRFIEIPDK